VVEYRFAVVDPDFPELLMIAGEVDPEPNTTAFSTTARQNVVRVVAKHEGG
jgi:hypothetical protein